jgi:single-stranded-DNA-specific exonuclease
METIKTTSEIISNTSEEVKNNKIRYINKDWTLNKFGNSQFYKKQKDELKDGLKISDFLATLLMNRGLDTKEKAIKFLFGEMSDLHSPFLLKDMKKAVERVALAINNNEKIGFFTDYDADGTTSNATFGLAFNKVLNYDNIVLYMPHRELEGYGLNNGALKKLKEQGCSVVVSADIGITAYEQAEYCKEIGIDLIITDHHLPKLPENYDKDAKDKSQFLPQAYALVNPNRPDCDYPFKGICGCFVAYKFLCALWMELGRDTSELDFLIPIVAIAIVSDIVPLLDENRIVVKKGLEIMNSKNGTGIVGLDALIEAAGLKNLDSDSIGFGIGPRINACGRMEHAMLASELLRTDDVIFAKERANEINILNENRKKFTKEVIEKAYEQVTTEYMDNNTMLPFYVEEVHVGVVGIGAGQLTEKLSRPSIIVTDHPELEGYLVGSARSVKGIDIFKILSFCEKAFDANDKNQRWGGHSQAAGLTIKKDRFPILAELINDYFTKNPIDPSLITPKIKIDKQIRVTDVNGKLMEDIQFLAPFGEANPKVQLALKETSCTISYKKNDTLGISILTLNSEIMYGVGFKMLDKAKDLNISNEVVSNLDVIFKPAFNEYQGRKSIQLMIDDFRRSPVVS